MFELLALIFAVLIGVFVLKVLFATLGLAFHILFFPVKLILGLVVMLLALPFLVLLLPVFLVLGLGFAMVGAVLGSIFLFFCPI